MGSGIMPTQIPSNVPNQIFFGEKILPVLQISVPRAALQDVRTNCLHAFKP